MKKNVKSLLRSFRKNLAWSANVMYGARFNR